MSLGSPLRKAVRSVTQDFLKLVLYLVVKSPGGVKSQTRTHRYSEHSCLLWGWKELPETHGGRGKKPQKTKQKNKPKTPKVKRGKAGREEAVFLKAWLLLQAE